MDFGLLNSALGRKRSRPMSYGSMASAPAPKRRFLTMPPPPVRFAPGRTRVGGFYGRYRGAGAEQKFLDTSLVLTNIATTGASIGSLNVVPQNGTQSGREGRKIVIKSISARLNLVIDSTNITGVTFRVIFFLDKQCNGAGTTATTDILTTADVYSFQNMANTERIKVLYDKVFVVNPAIANAAGVSVNALAKRIKFNKRCFIPIIYDSTATDGSLATIRSNNVQMLVVHNSGTAVPDTNGLCRIRYSDTQ